MASTATSFFPYLGTKELKDKKGLVKSLAAEFLGVLFLVLVGCGSCMGDPGNNDFVRIALAFGVTVATLAQSIGHISGCHINPAVTAGCFMGRKIGLFKGVMYILTQCLGGVAGAGILKAIGTEGIKGYENLGMTTVNDNLSPGQGFGIEFMITFVLVLVVFASAADANNAPNVKGSAPLAIGLSITTCHLFAIPFTGSSMNPARTFGPAVILGHWTNHWVYWLGPILGGVAAALVYQALFQAPEIGKNVEDKVEYNSVPTKGDDENEKVEP